MTDSKRYETSPWLILWIALPVLLIDQLSKLWVMRNMPLNSQRDVIGWLVPYFRFTYVANRGAAFGLFQSEQPAFQWLFVVLVLVIVAGLIIFNWRLAQAGRVVRIALGLVLAGAIGNLIDRLRVGYVIDFVDIDLSTLIPLRIADWYIFNVADLAVTSAIVLLFYISFRHPEQLDMQPATGAQPADALAAAPATSTAAAAPVTPTPAAVQPSAPAKLPAAPQPNTRRLLLGTLALAGTVWFIWRVATDESGDG